MDQERVIANILGPIPNTRDFFTYDYNKQFMSELNSNSLLGPLLYSAEEKGSGTGSPSPKKENTGLIAQNQVQEAANFIRYASGAITPIHLAARKTYDNLYQMSMANDNSLQQKQAQITLNNYLADLRVFTAQNSVGVANLYYILSKRLPQKQSTTDNNLVTSQALSEFNMASWRLFHPNLEQNTQWITQINQASAATVQKEIATLLAEINYQMYLDRQLQERILLTNSIMLIQHAKTNAPRIDVENQSGPPGEGR
jgi:intracellular multiplication protein IcmX